MGRMLRRREEREEKFWRKKMRGGKIWEKEESGEQCGANKSKNILILYGRKSVGFLELKAR